MKKFLSLVLALVMTMSLVTISAGAKDFTDSDKVTYDDAIEVMSELKVIDGYTDGSFRPTVELNRGAAAKIICNMILGPTTASALSASSAPFVDVPADSVFAGYITYCAKEGIINGYADGTFRPTAPLTGYAFMKMLLGALGYDADIEGYTGANWSVNVAKQAIGIGLDDGNDNFVGTKYVTREEACLYALNTLKAKMVEYGSKTTVTVNGAQVVVGGSEAKDVVNNAKDETFKDDNKMQFAEKYFPDLTTKKTTDDFGRPASIWKIKNKEVGTYTDDADATYTSEVKGKTIYADLNVDLDKTEWYATVDGVDQDDITDLKANFAVAKKNDVKIGGNGVLVEVFYDDDKDEGTITLINSYLMQVNGDYDEDDEELVIDKIDECDAPFTSKTLSSDDLDGLDAFADEDYVIVTVADGDVKTIEKAEMVTGTVTEYVVDDSVTMDGTEYEYADTYYDSDRSYEVKEDYELYLDAYGYVLLAKGVEADDNYVFVSEFASSSLLSTKAKVVAYAYFTDGSADEITVSKVDKTKVSGTDMNGVTNKWFKYVEKDGKYELTTADNTPVSVAAGDKVIDYKDSALKTYIGQGKDSKATKDTIFVVLDDDDNVKVYTGIKNVPAITAASDTSVYVSEDKDYAAVVFVDLGDGHTKGGATSSDVIYITGFDKAGTDSEDNDYYRYKAVVNGKLDQKVKFDVTSTALPEGLYTEIEYDSETGFVTEWVQVTAANIASGKVDDDDFSVLTVTGVDSQKAGVITFTVTTKDGTEEDAKYYMADDASILVVKYKLDSKGNTVVDEVKSVSAKTLVNDYNDAHTVYGVKNADGDYTALYIAK